MNVEIRHLRVAVAVADDLNMTKAAARLNLSQPTVSRTLAQLEWALGTALFDRSTHHVVVTDVGAPFLERARHVLIELDDAVAACSPAGPLRLGLSWSTGTHSARLLRAWKKRHPTRPLVLRRDDDRLAGLDDKLCDVALVHGPIDTKRWHSILISEEGRVAALPARHRLARRAELTLGDLGGQPLVINSRAGTTRLDLWAPDARPTVADDMPTIEEWLVAIASGLGFGLTAASTAQLHPHPDVRFVPVTDAPAISLLLV
jgi:DNA-binding transcriptional LysR family regulator